MMKKTILLSLLTIQALSVKACSDQNISFLQTNGSLQACIQATYQDTSTHSLTTLHYTKPVVLHPEFSVAKYLDMPARLQKNYYHEEAHYIYLGARGLKGGMKLQDKIDELQEVAISYAGDNSHGIDLAYKILIAKKAMGQALENQPWHNRSFWLDTEKQNEIKEQIQKNIIKQKEEYVEKEKKEGAKFSELQEELKTWKNRFHKDGATMKQGNEDFENDQFNQRVAMGKYVVGGVTIPLAQTYGQKRCLKKGAKLLPRKIKKSLKTPKGEKFLEKRDKLLKEVGQSMSGYAGSQFGRSVAQELEFEKNSAGDLTCRGTGTFVGRNVHGVVRDGFEKTFTKEAVGTNILASAGGIGGELLGEAIGGAIGEDCGNKERGKAIGGAVGSVATQTLVAALCLIM